MRLTFWGTRGSIAVPGPGTVRHGGNTACLEVVTGSGDEIILDAGTGLRVLGLKLARSMPLACAIFITHTHWDHIQGLPFFPPLFVPGNRVDIHGTFDPVGMKDIREVLAAQMEYAYFPVQSVQLAADIGYQTLCEGQTVQVGQALVTPVFMNHTVLTFGYKVEAGGKAVFYTGDHEDYANIYEPDEAGHEPYEAIIRRKRDQIAAVLRGVDVLVADAQYTDEEYPAKAGWGHSTAGMAVELARSAGIGRVFLTHHEPTRDDDALDALLRRVRERHAASGLDIRLAVEGETVAV